MHRQIVLSDPIAAAKESKINEMYLNYLVTNQLIPQQQYSFVPTYDVGTTSCLKMQWQVG